jgi:hypothetical protein
MAMGREIQTGSTLPGKWTNSRAMITAKTALTMRRSRKITTRKSVRERPEITSSVSEPMERALWRAEIQRVAKSWTPAKKMVPKITHSSAGSHPQKTAIAGPTMGAAPAIEVKWCPQSTCLLVGTKSVPSSSSWAGVTKSGSSRKIFSARNRA